MAEDTRIRIERKDTPEKLRTRKKGGLFSSRDDLRRMSAVMLFVLGALITAYPHVARYINNRSATRMVDTYFAQNAPGGPGGTSTEDMLNTEDMFGAIIIPKLGLELPIFTGSTDANLERGIAHMEGTSLPVGGESTHSVLAGHNGAVTNEWFTNIDQLTEGDLFYIRTLEQLLTYKVISSKVISPGAVSELYIQEGRDLVTLLTCTPNGSMRLIVTGERVLDEAWNTGN